MIENRDVRFPMQPYSPPRSTEMRLRETTRAGRFVLHEIPGQLQKLSDVLHHALRMSRGSEWIPDFKQSRLCLSISDSFLCAAVRIALSEHKKISRKQSRDKI